MTNFKNENSKIIFIYKLSDLPLKISHSKREMDSFVYLESHFVKNFFFKIHLKNKFFFFFCYFAKKNSQNNAKLMTNYF